jgi:hypothetical protein
MYIPVSELQQYRGQWMCPYCVQDMRDQDRKAEERFEHHEKPRVDVITYVEQCERCGRDLQGKVYVWNGRKLCKRCLDDAKDSWTLETGKPMGPGQRIKVDVAKKDEQRSIFERSIGEILVLAGMKKKPISEIVIYHPKMQGEIQAAKPLDEKTIIGQNKEQRIEIEGIMTKDEKVVVVPAKKEEPKPPLMQKKAEIVAAPPSGPVAAQPQEKKSKRAKKKKQ